MGKSRVAVAAVFLLLTITVFSVPILAEGENSDLSFTIRSSFTYSNRGTAVWNLTEEDRAVGLFMNNSWQTVRLANYSLPLNKTEVDDDGNPIAVLQFPKMGLGPGESVSFNVSYEAVSKPHPSIDVTEQESGTLADIPANLSEYLSSGDAWLINDTNLKNLANNLTKDETKVLAMVGNFVSWIAEHIEYPSSEHEVPQYPNETYRTREGDCDDQAILLITLCRISKIPAYLQIGCIYIPSLFTNETCWDGHARNVQEKIGWHGWAMVYVPPWGWLPVDLTYSATNPTQLVSQPLRAIENAAVTSQNVIQYMNVSRTEYVASSLEAREFIQDNGFYIYERDEMVQNVDQEETRGFFWGNLLKEVLIAAGITAVIIVFVIYSRRRTLSPTEQQKVQ